MESKVSIDLSILNELEADIARQYLAMEYRPVVVMILFDKNGKVLIAQSAINTSYWGFIQGGIDRAETLIQAAGRELQEESGDVVLPKDVHISKYCGTDQIDMPGWEKRDGFQKGKKYYYLLAFWDKCGPIKPQPEELADHIWLDPSDVELYFATVNPIKRNSLLVALKIATQKAVQF